MATYTGTDAVHDKTLNTDVADKVTLEGDFQTITLFKLSSGAELYYRVHESDADAAANPAVVAGDGVRVIPDGLAAWDIQTPGAATIITIVSGQALRYSVQGGEG